MGLVSQKVWIGWGAGLIGLGVFCGEAPAESGADDYLREIKPLLAERCFACHGALKQKGKLRLDTAAAVRESGVLEGGADGELLARIQSSDPDERMPPEGEGARLNPEEVAAVRAWIETGAQGPADEVPEDDPAAHWAFQPIRRPDVDPAQVDPGSNPMNPIDRYFAKNHAEVGLVPQPEAERGLLLRRLYLDLTGLPPTAEELAAEDAFETVVDTLLASPRHGERWARHWMDIWRYSDAYGLNDQLRYSQHHLWHWRDWIVESLNADRGYDEMIRHMLAGDEIAPTDPAAVAATGFLARNYYLFNRTTWLDSTIEHTGKAFLGLTMNCAKCHDHKYDPITQEDYYRFRAIFEPHQVRLDPIPGQTDFKRDGLPRVFDDHPEAVTFLHRRGNPSDPDPDLAITPAVPTFLADLSPANPFDPEPVNLPVEAWAPGVRPHVRADRIAAAETAIAEARKQLQEALGKLAYADVKNKKSESPEPPTEPAPAAPQKNPAPTPHPAFTDSFDREAPDRWTLEGGGWRYQGGSLVQTESAPGGKFARSQTPHPRDFAITLEFRITGGEVYKSAGLRFDVTGDGTDSHTVYASAHAPGPKVQIAHTTAGKTRYPRRPQSPQNRSRPRLFPPGAGAGSPHQRRPRRRAPHRLRPPPTPCRGPDRTLRLRRHWGIRPDRCPRTARRNPTRRGPGQRGVTTA